MPRSPRPVPCGGLGLPILWAGLVSAPRARPSPPSANRADGLFRRLLRGGGGAGVAEGRDHLLCEAVEVSELNVERGAERCRAYDAVEAGVALLDRLQLLDDVLRPSGKKAARLYRVLNRRQFAVPTSFGSRIAAICSSIAHRVRGRCTLGQVFRNSCSGP